MVEREDREGQSCAHTEVCSVGTCDKNITVMKTKL